GLGEDRLFRGATDLAPANDKCGDKLDIAATVAANGLTHHALERSTLAVTVVLHTLHHRTGTIADPGNSNFDDLHATTPPKGVIMGLLGTLWQAKIRRKLKSVSFGPLH